MTVSANYAFEMTRDQLIRRAMQAAQLLDPQAEPNGDEVAMAADFLNTELQSLASDGVTLYQNELATMALTAGTYSYDPLVAPNEDFIDLAISPDGIAGSVYAADGIKTPVRAINVHERNLITDTTTEASRPTTVFIDRSLSMFFDFWPVPTVNLTFSYRKIRLIRDVDTGAVTVDVARRWQKYLWLQTAAYLARALSKPLDLVQDLRSEAREAKKAAQNSDREKVGGQFYVPRYYGGC